MEQQHLHPPEADEPNLMDLLSALWRQRTAIVCTMLVSVLLAVIVIAVLFVGSPRAETVALPFRLRFPGALEGRYPNGQAFQPADVSAASVVAPVVEGMGLERFASYEEIKSSLSVIETSPALERLRREYEARLSNSRLTQVERAALESEYEAKRNSARSAEFVVLVQRDQIAMPAEVAGAFMHEVIKSWADEAISQRGAWTYDLAIPGRGILQEGAIDEEDYLIAIDMVRSVLRRVDAAVRQLAEIPGANLVRTSDAPNLSLVELQARIDDMRRFKIAPLLGRIRTKGSFRDREATTIYVQDQLYHLQRQARAMTELMATIDDVFGRLRTDGLSAPQRGDATMHEGAGMVIPQFNEGFLNRLMTLGAETTDVDFRRELAQRRLEYHAQLVELQSEESFYQEILDSMEQAHQQQHDQQERQLNAAQVDTRFAAILNDTRTLIDQLQILHQEISRQNLRPEAVYQITGPLRQQRQGLPKTMMAGILVAALGLGGMLSLLVVAIRERQARLRREKAFADDHSHP